MRLNELPDSGEGYIKLWMDDKAEVYITDIRMRNNADFGIDGLFFSTFYGGGDSSWACPQNTSTYFRNFRLFTDTMVQDQNELPL